MVHALTRTRLGETLDADAAAADALSQVAGGLGSLRDPQAYPHWLYRITTRCVAWSRRRWPRTPSLEPAETADPDGGPLQRLVDEERRTRLRAAVGTLAPRLREPLLLHFLSGLTYREIARVTGTSLGTVSRRMSHALARLKTKLGEET